MANPHPVLLATLGKLVRTENEVATHILVREAYAKGVRRRRTLIGNASSWQKPSFPKINKDGIFGTHRDGA